MKKYDVYDKVFKCSYRLYINGTFKQFVKAASQYVGEEAFDEIEDAPALCVTTADGGIILYVQEFDYDNPESISSLAHECVHACQGRLLEACGVPWQDKETPAYYVGFLMLEFLSKLKNDKHTPTRNS